VFVETGKPLHSFLVSGAIEATRRGNGLAFWTLTLHWSVSRKSTMHFECNRQKGKVQSFIVATHPIL